jgi:hypothetical protein
LASIAPFEPEQLHLLRVEWCVVSAAWTCATRFVRVEGDLQP